MTSLPEDTDDDTFGGHIPTILSESLVFASFGAWLSFIAAGSMFCRLCCLPEARSQPRPRFLLLLAFWDMLAGLFLGVDNIPSVSLSFAHPNAQNVAFFFGVFFAWTSFTW